MRESIIRARGPTSAVRTDFGSLAWICQMEIASRCFHLWESCLDDCRSSQENCKKRFDCRKPKLVFLEDPAMDSHQVRQLEEQVASATTGVLKSHFPGYPESPRITHLMAKAAVAVLEAVVCSRAPRTARPRRTSALFDPLPGSDLVLRRRPGLGLPGRRGGRRFRPAAELGNRRQPCLGHRLQQRRTLLHRLEAGALRRRLRGRPIHGLLRPARAAGARGRGPDCPHRAPVASPGLRWTAQTMRAGSGRISRSLLVREAEV